MARAATVTAISITFAVSMLCIGRGALADEPSLEAQFQEAYTSSKSLADKGRYADAVPFAKTALELGEKLYGEADPSTAKLTLNYGELLSAVRRDPEAISALDLAVKRYEALYGKDSTELITPLSARGIAWTRSDPIQARPDFDRAIRIARTAAPDDFEREAQLNGNAGEALLAAGAAEAGPYLKRSYQILQGRVGDGDERTATAAFALARFERAIGHPKESLRLANLAMSTWSNAETPNTKKLLLGHAYLVDAYEQAGDHASATAHAQAIGALQGTMASDGNRDVMPLFRVNPDYPRSAQMNGEEGWVQIEFTIDTNGAVKDPKVVDHEGNPAFIDTALAALRRWRYAPKYVDGQPVDRPGIRVVLRFNLEP